MLDLGTEIRYLKGVGPRMEAKLNRLGIETIDDLIHFYPRTYQDYSNTVLIKDAHAGSEVTLKVIVWEVLLKRTKSRKKVLEVTFSDNSGTIKAVWFNQPYLATVFKEGGEYYLSGKVTPWRDEPVLTNPNFEAVSYENLHTARLLPIYPETPGVSSKYIRRLLFSVRELITDRTVYTLHFPENIALLKTAQEEMAFREVYELLKASLKQKKELEAASAPAIPYDAKLIKNFVSKLPYELTKSQRIVLHQILTDLAEPHPMNRLLEGEVGSGKTVVAAAAMLLTAKSGFRAVLMSPTEILARQHTRTIKDLLKPFGVSVGLMTGTVKPKQLPDVIVGTHALIQKNVVIPDLALAVVDEQHRFGVAQRARLNEINSSHLIPHMLSLSATPIPRTLAMTVYGDLDISILKELPLGRKKIATKVVRENERSRAYEFLRKEINQGRQVFVICPLIDESDKLGYKSVLAEHKKLDREVFPELAIGLLHGKMKPDEKEKVMKDFKAGIYKVLVATPVVEVGVDVPNASVMVIESAERFGLAQLHQFRGRVGRAEHQSYCYIFFEGGSLETYSRLKAMEKTNDGFELSELDLKLRGPGEFKGSRQSGYLSFRFASIYDSELIARARAKAEADLAFDRSK